MRTGTYLTEEKIIREIDRNYNYDNKRVAIIAVINKMDEKDVDRFWQELNELIDFKNKHNGKFCFEKNNEPNQLLHNFWQRASDACPLEAKEAESQETEFNDWVIDQYEQINFNL